MGFKWLACVMRFVVFTFAILFLPGLPPDLEFKYHEFPTPRQLDGPLSLNNKLDNAEKLFLNEIKGPEGLMIFNNELYMSLHGGVIMKLANDKLIPIIKTGQPCEGIWEERKCGRPLGLTFDTDGFLYIADAYYGIIKANVTSGEKSLLISMHDPINDKVPMIPNGITVSRDGIIYWTDSSVTHYLEDGMISMLGSGTGRLIMYDQNKEKNDVLIEDLNFPNGVALSSDESFLIVAESGSARILKYHLKGKLKGQHEVFVDNLPGLPDNLHLNGKEGFIVALVYPEGSDILSVRIQLARLPLVRKFLARILSLFDLLFNELDYYFPSQLAKKTAHWIGHFESTSSLSGQRCTIILLDNEGNITGSLHSTDGTVQFVSDIISNNGYYYLGSPYNSYLGRVKI